MTRNIIIRIIILVFIFHFAFVLELIPISTDYAGLRPSYVLLTLLYWTLALPYIISIMTAFVVGLMWDITQGDVLGQHALILSIFSYFVTKFHLKLRNLSIIPAVFLVGIGISIVKFAFFALDNLQSSHQFDNLSLVGSLISALLWPLVVVVMRFIRHRFWRKTRRA